MLLDNEEKAPAPRVQEAVWKGGVRVRKRVKLSNPEISSL
jgi:hypothetical protein